MSSFSRAVLGAAWLHGDHVLCARQGQFDDPQDGLTDAFQWIDAGREGQQQHVEPGDEEGDGPGQHQQRQEPEDGPDKAWAEVARAATFTCSHGDVVGCASNC